MTQRILKIVLASLLLISAASFFLFQKPITSHIAKIRTYIIDWTWIEDISCHYVKEGDALQPARDLAPPRDSIFFHETSCRGGLNSRQACAVESAARKHPERSVFVFFNSPVSEAVLMRSCLAKLTQFNNVRLVRLYTEEYAQKTDLSLLLARRENNLSRWQIEITSDMLRYITMYKYGGVYLDTDVLVVKSLDSLGKDWVAREDDDTINVAAMAISYDGVGHHLVTDILEDIKQTYQPVERMHTGPHAMYRALAKFCTTSIVKDFNASTCHGFNVYEQSLLYPLHYSEVDFYFYASSTVNPEFVESAFAHHFWNQMTRNMTVEPGSLYDRLAREHCPTIWELYGDYFGS